ncbi:hypothetical protein ACF08W_31695 [Streptomyces sp. NPDC015144]|uniref:hypothetical protein n=1 Tax=Streptomyces sp. NPDC015144 TaxID=3364944 RepID=UPI0037026342
MIRPRRSAARAAAHDVRALVAGLPEDDRHRPLAELVVDQTEDCLARPPRDLHRVRDRARTLRALYERLDRLQGPGPFPTETTDPASA